MDRAEDRSRKPRAPSGTSATSEFREENITSDARGAGRVRVRKERRASRGVRGRGSGSARTRSTRVPAAFTHFFEEPSYSFQSFCGTSRGDAALHMAPVAFTLPLVLSASLFAPLCTLHPFFVSTNHLSPPPRIR